MNSEERIRALSMKVAAAPDDSEEFSVAMKELREALNENAIQDLVNANYLENNGRLRVTPKGRLVLNTLIAALIDDG